MQAEKHRISGAFGLDNAPDNQKSHWATHNPLGVVLPANLGIDTGLQKS
jgi:hypothetical protein